jgi:hypothetical protein
MSLPPRLRDIADPVVNPRAATMPKDRTACAQALPAKDLDVTPSIVGGSCDLRGLGCTARGSIGPVRVYFHRTVQYHACAACQAQFGWPTS